MAEPTIVCPSCRTEIKLTESLAAPLIESTRKDYENRLAQKDADFAKREQTLRMREESLARAREALDEQVAEKLKLERTKIAADEARKAKLALAGDLETKARELAELHDVLRQRDEKLAEAQKAQAELIRKQRELDDAKREMDLTVETRVRESLSRAREQARKEAEEKLSGRVSELQEILKQRDEKLAEAQQAQAELIRKRRELDDAKREMELTIETRVQQSLGRTREQAKKEAEEQLALRVLERDQTIASLQKNVDELKRKLEQGSQQLQGEALELQLETVLSAKFPHDLIEPVPKGEHGGDILQKVVTPTGTGCGTIIWETKRTKNWIDGWLPKLREDQRAAKAEIAIIVSAVLPKNVETFDQIDGVWVVHPRAIVPVAMALRNMLVEVNCARQASDGQHGKMELIYHYLTGPRFRLRVQAIVEAFSAMSEDLQKERKAISKCWAKREEQIERVMQATVGMYGDLQGIAGKTLQEIDGLEFPPHSDDEAPLLNRALSN